MLKHIRKRLGAATVEGWLSKEEAAALKQLARNVRVHGCIVEIGTYRGRSSIAMAEVIDPNSGVRVFAIDPHDPFVGVNGGQYGPVDQQELYRAIADRQLGSIIAVICLSSKAASSGWDRGPIDILWLDGDHSYKGLKNDLACWLPHMGSDGIVAFHDTNLPDVQAVIGELRDSYSVIDSGQSGTLQWLKLKI